MFSRLWIEKSDVTARVDAEGSQGLAIMNAAEKVVSPTEFLTAGEVQWQHKVGDLDVVDLVGFRLYRVAHFVPVKDIQLRVGWMRAGHQQIHLRIGNEFQSFVRQCYSPTFSQALGQFGENKAKGNAAIISIVVTQRVRHIDIVPEINNGISAHVRWLLLLGFCSRLALQSQHRPQTPVRFKVLLDLAVDGAKRMLYLFVAELAVGVIDDGNDHSFPPFIYLLLVRITAAGFRHRKDSADTKPYGPDPWAKTLTHCKPLNSSSDSVPGRGRQ